MSHSQSSPTSQISPLTFFPRPERYFQPHQARTRTPTTFEDLLGDAIERAFGQGHWELPALVAYLNQSGPLGPNGEPWSAESFQATMQTLGA